MRYSLAIGIVFLQANVFAATTTSTGTDVIVEYDEPATFSDGKPLTNLGKTTLFYNVGQGSVTYKDVPASKLSGGWHQIQPMSVPVKTGEQKTLRVWGNATSTNSLVSANSSIATLILDSLAPGGGITGVAIAGVEVDVSYTEPTKNADGTPLNDLLKTDIYYDLGAGPILAREVAATANGGKQVKERILVPVLDDMESNVKFWWIAVDMAGNVGSKAFPAVKRVDFLAPGATH